MKRKLHGNFTFLVITDRDDLDTQIHKTFVRTEVVGDKEECQPKNAVQLREFLSGNKPLVFTLIHKFQYDKTKKYPVLSTRSDIFVLVDEAHRTQYKQLAENMHTGLPNANYIAFTGTPLLGSKRLTNQWFGDYVSEYNFAQAIEDGSTVPLFYSRRVPEVGLTNDWLDTDIDQGLEEEELEIFDLLRSDRKLTKEEEQKVILAAKNLYQKLLAEKEKVLVVDWYKDEQPRHQVFALIQTSLNEDLPMSYDRVSFNDKTHLLFNHFVDMAVQGYGWVA